MILLGRRFLRERWDTVHQLQVFSRVSRRMPDHPEIPIVLVHGLGVSSRYMTPLATEWAREHAVYVPDLPGYGQAKNRSMYWTSGSSPSPFASGSALLESRKPHLWAILWAVRSW